MKKNIVLLTALLILPLISANGFDFKINSSLKSSSTNNVFKDSSEASDFFTTGNATGYLYFIPSLEVKLFSEYTYYSNKVNLNNLQSGGGFTFIPLNDSSKASLYFSGSYRDYSYKKENSTNSSEFISKSINGIASFGYKPCELGQFRLGYQFQLTGYGDENFEDKLEHTIFAGINRTFLKNNSIDIETGYSFGNFNYLDSSFGALNGILDHFDSLRDESINSIYYSLRYSRPLGNKSGISLSFSKRAFQNKDDFKSTVVLGYTSGFQDPWESLFEGESYQLKLKTYILPRFITSFGFAYLEKDYFRHIEETIFNDPFLGDIRLVTTLRPQERYDFSRRYYLNFQYPIVLSKSSYIEPSLKFEYTRNSSTIDVYDYEDLTISGSLSFTFM